MKTKDGEIRYASLTAHLIRGQDGAVVGVGGALRDITERKRAEEALRQSEERFRDLYENAPNAYFSVDRDGLVRRCNKRAGQLLGCAPGQLVGRAVFDLYADTPDGTAKAQKVFQRFQAGEDIHDEELQMQRADGTPVWISLTVNAVRNADGEVIESRSMVVDITERKRAEEALQRAREELEDRVEREMQRGDNYGLTFRELTVLHLVAAGKSDKDIGLQLAISPLTARKHIEHILAKMGSPSRTEASVRALRQGLLDSTGPRPLPLHWP